MPQRPRNLDPDASPLAKFGARLRAHRTEQGWAQAELGRLVHVSGTLIAKMERAERRPQPDVAASLDTALHTDGELSRLAADALRDHLLAPPSRSPSAPPHPAGRHAGIDADWQQPIDELGVLADRYDLPEDGRTRSVPELQAAVKQLVDWRLDSDYSRLVVTVPRLIPELTRALLSTAPGKKREDVAAALVQAWRAADAVAVKLGMFDLSARLILVMGWAATQSGGDGLAMAATSYVRAETFFVSGQEAAGHRMLVRAASGITPGDSQKHAAQYGALHMRAAIAAARAGFREEAKDHLSEARSMTEIVTTEGIWEGTAFGPASVRVHEVSTAVELDAPQTALAAAAGWQPPTTLPAERRSHFFVDLARAQLALGEHEAVLRTLREAHTIAPQNVQVDLEVRRTLAALAGTSAANAFAAEDFRQTVARTKVIPDQLAVSSGFGSPGSPALPGPPGRGVRAALPASAPPSRPSA